MDFQLSRMKRPALDKKTVSRSLCWRQDILQKGLAIPQQAGIRGQYTAALPHPHLFFLAKEGTQRGGGGGASIARKNVYGAFIFIKCNYVWGYPLYIGEVASQFPGKCSIVGYSLLL